MGNIQITIPEEHKDKYVLCSTPKHGYAYNSLLFWGKNSSGHKPNLNTCQLYTKEEAMSRASENTIPIKLVDLVETLAVHAEHASGVLNTAKKHYKQQLEELEGGAECQK